MLNVTMATLPKLHSIVSVPGGHIAHRQDQHLMRRRLRKRYETVNRRLKVFKVLDTVFGHHKNGEGLRKHLICFRVAAIMAQLALECGQQQLFDMREYDDDISDNEATEIFGV